MSLARRIGMRISTTAAQPQAALSSDARATTREQARFEKVSRHEFPQFVGELVGGVFEATVDASIQQMEAYADLLASMTETEEDSGGDNSGGDED